MKITVVQTNTMHDKAKNIARATGLIEQAIAADKPDVLVLPEVWNWRGGARSGSTAAA